MKEGMGPGIVNHWGNFEDGNKDNDNRGRGRQEDSGKVALDNKSRFGDF